MQSSEVAIAKNAAIFSAIEQRVLKITSLKRAVRLAEYAAKFSNTNPAGIYASHLIENHLQALAAKAEAKTDHFQTEVRANTVLHVMTQAYLAGGHTRVVERWIEFDQASSHSVVLIAQKKETIPSALEQLTEASGGGLIRLATEGAKLGHLELRKLASSFDKVVLHTHPYETMPVLAFRRGAFQRPVFCYNHADHLFWYGTTIIDHCFEMCRLGLEFSIDRRGAFSSSLLPIPMPCVDFKPNDKMLARQELTISGSEKVFLTIASAGKFPPKGAINYKKLAEKILSISGNRLLVVGLNKDQFEHVFGCSLTGSVEFYGHVPYSNLSKFYLAADFYLDSVPIGGGTAVLEAMLYGGRPIVWLNGYHQPDSYIRYAQDWDSLLSGSTFEYDELEPNRLAGFNADENLLQHLKESWLLSLANYADTVKRKSRTELSVALREITLYDVNHYESMCSNRDRVLVPPKTRHMSWLDKAAIWALMSH